MHTQISPSKTELGKSDFRWVLSVSVSWLCITVLQNVTMGETGQSVQGVTLDYFLQLHVNLQLSQ